MGAQEAEILNNITSQTQSDLILFFVLMIVALIAFFLPLYKMMTADKKDNYANENTRQENYIKRESRIIEVITANTEVMAGLKVTLDAIGSSTNTSFAQVNNQLAEQRRVMDELVGASERTLRILESRALADGVRQPIAEESGAAAGLSA